MKNVPFLATNLNGNVIDLKIPSIGVDHYPIYRNDNEDNATLHHRVELYAEELVRRHDVGEPYAIGYRECKDGKIRLVIRKVEDGITYQKAMGYDEDFRKVE